MLLHIPHASGWIPSKYRSSFYNDVHDELYLMTDFYTDELFEYDGATTLIFPYSRLICDVERFTDDVMNDRGMGICYTHTFDGRELKYIDRDGIEDIMSTFYNPHHYELNSWATKTLPLVTPLIVDCHSFDDRMFVGKSTPDFCIGSDDVHTPKGMVYAMKSYLISNGYTVSINSPFSGCMVPSEYIGNSDVKSVMIEVNKRLYLTDDFQKSDNFNNIKNIISNLLRIADDWIFDRCD